MAGLGQTWVLKFNFEHSGGYSGSRTGLLAGVIQSLCGYGIWYTYNEHLSHLYWYAKLNCKRVIEAERRQAY